MYTHICIYMYIYIYICTYIHIYIYVWVSCRWSASCLRPREVRGTDVGAARLASERSENGGFSAFSESCDDP